MWLDIVFVVAGIALVLFFAGRLVKGTIAFACGFGLSVFVVRRAAQDIATADGGARITPSCGLARAPA